jgi:hypothetical protein
MHLSIGQSFHTQISGHRSRKTCLQSSSLRIRYGKGTGTLYFNVNIHIHFNALIPIDVISHDKIVQSKFPTGSFWEIEEDPVSGEFIPPLRFKVLTLRKLIFDTGILKILKTMNLKGVTSLVFDRVLDKDLVAEGLFYISDGKLKSRHGLPTVERPLLPNLKRVKYTVASRNDLGYTCNGTQELRSRVFLKLRISN